VKDGANEDTVNEEALMAAYVEGDPQAFSRLFRSLAPRVHGFFLRRFGDPAVADDLLQMTFMKIHRARHDYRRDSPLRPWVFTIAARVGLDEHRRRGRRPEAADDERLKQLPQDAAAGQAPLDGQQLVERAQLAAEVRAALQRLPESQRVVIHLHRYEGLTFDQIGQVLGTTEGAVKLRAFRAYEQLRKDLAPLLAAEDGARGDDEPGAGS
jgi:RNA polymerase sigma-70 factor (ECF subfamily)